jgi:hypothetical protein
MDSLLNLYELKNLSTLQADYRLVTVGGFIGRDADVAEEKLRSLTEQIAYTEHVPVAIVAGGTSPVLAVPANHEFAMLQHQLTPEVVTLQPQNERKTVQLGQGSEEARRVGESFLKWALRQPLRDDRELWSANANSFVNKRPFNAHDATRDIDVFHGFSYGFRWLEGKLYLVLNPATRYVETRWLTESVPAERLAEQRMRHGLYHFGEQWYRVQLMEVTQQPILATQFTDRDGTLTNVYDYTRKVWQDSQRPWIRDLDPQGPAIVYRAGNRKPRHGAAALFKRTIKTNDPRLKAMRVRAGLEPEARFLAMEEVVRRLSGRARFDATPILIERKALRRRLTAFRVPPLEFGHGKRLEISSRESLRELGRSRLELLTDPGAGFAVTGSLSRQYLVVPKSLPRSIVDDFAARVQRQVRGFINRDYRPEQLIYDDHSARTLRQQVEAIRGVVDRANAHGHGLLILPPDARTDLHNFLKRQLHPRLQVQCVSASKLESYYTSRSVNGRPQRIVKRDLESQYRSYLRNTTLGLMLVNRNWGWVLPEGLHADCYIGFDVLYGMACFVFLYDGGRQCVVRTVPTRQKEQLTRQQLRATITKGLQDDLAAGVRVNSIVLQRDGRLFQSEWQGVCEAVNSLQNSGALGRDVMTAGVAIAKTSTVPVRVGDVTEDGHLENTRLGVSVVLAPDEGNLCTTGHPFRVRGTCTMLNVRVVRGTFPLAHALEDTFRLSQLSWAAPDKSMRLPITLKLCDDFLRSIASAADDHAAEFGEDGEDMGEAAEERPASAGYGA